MPIIKQIKDNIIVIVGKENYEENQKFQLSKNCIGIVLSAKSESAKLLALGDISDVKVNFEVKKLKSETDVNVYEHYFGKIISPFGDVIHPIHSNITNKKLIGKSHLENSSPSIIDRVKLTDPLETGVLAIDTIIPIGKGQRELIIGDRSTGKTSIALSIIINQRDKNTKVIYAAIGQKRNSVISTYNILKNHNAIENLIFLYANSKSPAEQFYLPKISMAMAEALAYNGENVLVIIDDLTKHANIYREISLTIGKLPGRESYPSDMFFQHSSLLERAGRFSSKYNSGSITCIPIVETVQGDIASLIPSNIISITDGQIFTSEEKFNSGIFPAINIGLSVSRTGSSVQTALIKNISKDLKITYSSLIEIKKFADMSIDITEELSTKIKQWDSINNLLVQHGYLGFSQEMMYILIMLYKNNKLIKIKDIASFSIAFRNFCSINTIAKFVLKNVSLDVDMNLLKEQVNIVFEPLVKAANNNFGGTISSKEYNVLKRGQ